MAEAAAQNLAVGGDVISAGASGLERLIEIGLALSAERNHDRLTEMILLEAMSITKADGGTLYLRTDQDALKFTICLLYTSPSPRDS